MKYCRRSTLRIHIFIMGVHCFMQKSFIGLAACPKKELYEMTPTLSTVKTLNTPQNILQKGPLFLQNHLKKRSCEKNTREE